MSETQKSSLPTQRFSVIASIATCLSLLSFFSQRWDGVSQGMAMAGFTIIPLVAWTVAYLGIIVPANNWKTNLLFGCTLMSLYVTYIILVFIIGLIAWGSGGLTS